MNRIDALAILKHLANGLDPSSGEVLADTSPFNQPAVIRALHFAVQHLGEPPKPLEVAKPAKPRGEKAGQKWSPEEDVQLIQGVNAKKSIPDLMRIHQRSRGAITSRLDKLETQGKISRQTVGN